MKQSRDDVEDGNNRNLPISFQKYSFKEDIHHVFYLCPFLLQLYEERQGTNQTPHVSTVKLYEGALFLPL